MTTFSWHIMGAIPLNTTNIYIFLSKCVFILKMEDLHPMLDNFDRKRGVHKPSICGVTLFLDKAKW